MRLKPSGYVIPITDMTGYRVWKNAAAEEELYFLPDLRDDVGRDLELDKFGEIRVEWDPHQVEREAGAVMIRPDNRIPVVRPLFIVKQAWTVG